MTSNVVPHDVIERVVQVVDRLSGSRHTHCVPRAPVREVQSRVNLSAYCLNPQNTMHFTRFSLFKLYDALRQWLNRVKCIVLYGFKQ